MTDGPVYFISQWHFGTRSDPLQIELLNFHPEGNSNCFNVGTKGGGGGFCILIIFKDTKLVRRKQKDKIENLVSKILPRFYKQMYLWVVFLEMVVTEK